MTALLMIVVVVLYAFTMWWVFASYERQRSNRWRKAHETGLWPFKPPQDQPLRLGGLICRHCGAYHLRDREADQ